MARANVATAIPRIGSGSAANWMFHQIATEPLAPLTAAIVGAGGTGKTALLDEVARAYENAGVELIRAGTTRDVCAETLDSRGAVLVDDAHRLDPRKLDELRGHADADGARLIVAYRPWPRSSSLSALGASIAPGRAPVVLSHLGRTEVASRIADLVSRPPPDSLVDLVHEQSGGLPALVDLVTHALRDAGRFDPRHPERFRRPDRIRVSTGSAERLRHHVDVLEPEVYRLLQAMAVGVALDAEVLTAVLDADPDELVGTVEAARATGLITEGGRLIPFIQGLVLRLMPVLRTREMQRRLADVQLERGGSVLDAGRQLLGTGATGSRVAAVLEAAGNEALRQSPELAAELLGGAVEAGGSSHALAGRRAQAVALTGDLDQALQLADQAISDPTAADHKQATSVIAAVMAHRGLPARSAELYQRLPADAAGGAALAVPALVGNGELAQARAVLATPGGRTDRPPSLLAEAASLMAHGMITSVEGSPTSALSQLARAAALLEPAGATVLLPDTPAALTALVALHRGELTVAESALRRGVAAKLGGRPALIRGLLLYGWTAMARGNLSLAHRTMERATRGGHRLEPRDELFAAALATALARREDELTTLTAEYSRARDSLVCHPVDLYSLLPLGELAVAGARLGEPDWTGPHLQEAQYLLDRLGEPALWAVPLHWSMLHAAIIAEDPAESERHATALRDAASSSPHAAMLAAAGRCWLSVLMGPIDRETVEAASRGLHGMGLAWEASRLAGQAAVRATDRRTMAALHACARTLQGEPVTPELSPTTAGEPRDDRAEADAPTVSTDAHASDVAPTSSDDGVLEPERSSQERSPLERSSQERSLLSERELDVSELILAGLTYKQIGQKLFISAKTVEHHVARIRQRLGVSTRNELFGRLQTLVHPPPPAGTRPAGY